jgi:hypothetical protein
VFDTLRGRSFRLEAPGPGCRLYAIGGGLAVWSCFPPETLRLTSLSTGGSLKPTGIEPVERRAAEPGVFCTPWRIGRYWLEYSCGIGFGPGDAMYYLNHRTGRITGGDEIQAELLAPDAPFFADLSDAGLFRPYCAPLGRPRDGAHAPPFFDYAPPFALHASEALYLDELRFGSIRLRRCGTKRAEILSRCRLSDCLTPQLGSRYVTWGGHERVYAYLPRTRRRVLVGRALADYYLLSVAHTCNRIFALSGNTVYAARFEPASGAPPCQHRR